MEISSPKNKTFHEVTLRSQKIKKIHLKYFFGKYNFLAPSLKNFLYFRGELAKPENQKFLIFLFTIFCLLRENFSNISAKEKSLLYFPL